MKRNAATLHNSIIMKNLSKAFIIGLLFMIGTVLTTTAQITLPDENARATLTQEIGLTEVYFEYTRPATKGHVIFGERIPYGERWLTTDWQYLRARFDDDMLLDNGDRLPAGNYAIEVIPNENQWVIIFKKGEWKQATMAFLEEDMIYMFETEPETYFSTGAEVARITVIPEKLAEQADNFTVQLMNICTTCAQVQLSWDFTRVTFGISNEIDEQVQATIHKFTTNPELKLSGQYYLAAKYYLDTNKDLDKALEWINKSLEYGPDAYWVMHTKAEILAKQGDLKAAINTAEESQKMAEKKGDMDFVRINQLEIQRWKDQRKGS